MVVTPTTITMTPSAPAQLSAACGPLDVEMQSSSTLQYSVTGNTLTTTQDITDDSSSCPNGTQDITVLTRAAK